ncbi:MAG TPA: hypothetical protein VJR29_14215 [bacterium]|nr:hypothetical protein [bacterium]
MTPPTSLSACPPEIREHPLPGDRCTAPTEPYHPPERRFRHISLVVEAPAFSLRSGSAGGVDFRYRTGINALFRPHSHFHAGLGIDTDYNSELTLMGRAGAFLPLNPLRMYGLGFTGLVGLRQVFDQTHAVGGAEAPVSGSLLAFGAEISLHFQIAHEFSLVAPYYRLMVSPATELDRSGGGRVSLPWSWEMAFGIGLSFDFLPGGN